MSNADPDADPDVPPPAPPYVAPSNPPPYTASLMDISTLSADARVLAQDILEFPPGVRQVVLGLCEARRLHSPLHSPSHDDDVDAEADQALALAINYIVRTAKQAEAVRGTWLTLLNYVVIGFSTSLLCYLEVVATDSIRPLPVLGIPLGVLFILLVPISMVLTRYERPGAAGFSGGLNGLVWLLSGLGPLVTATLPILAALHPPIPTTRLRTALGEMVKVSAALAALFGAGTFFVLRQIDKDVKVYWALGGDELPTPHEFITSIVRVGARAYEGVNAYAEGMGPRAREGGMRG